jgi:hypothetical protein
MDQKQMKQKLLVVAVAAAFITGCASNKPVQPGAGVDIPAGPQQAISEQRVVSDFTRQGVKVVYDLKGNVQAMEVAGYAPVWGGSENAVREAYRVAELEAKKSLNDFIHKETITSSVSVAMVSRNLEKARDNKTNNFATNRNRDQVAARITDAELENNLDQPVTDANKDDVNREENTAIRNDAMNIASRVNTVITATNKGIISGLYLVEGEAINGGKNVRVLYRWDTKSAAARPVIRNLMSQ